MLVIKPGQDTVTKTLRMPAYINRELERLAEENNTTFTSVVLQCLQYALDNIDGSAGGK
ncbi:MAG: hypothetical protein IJB30_01410 [Clostridia bacterium]|nr:hypothetical protein [Clostridia bacterium]